MEIHSLMEDTKVKNLEERKEGSHSPIEGINEISSNKCLITKGTIILPTNYKKHIKGVYIQQDKNARLNNLQTHLLQYLANTFINHGKKNLGMK